MSEGDYAAVESLSITVPSDVNVINPLPNLARTNVEPGDQKMLTMTTCHPQYSNAERMIIHAVQVREDPKKPGYTPPELSDIS